MKNGAVACADAQQMDQQRTILPLSNPYGDAMGNASGSLSVVLVRAGAVFGSPMYPTAHSPHHPGQSQRREHNRRRLGHGGRQRFGGRKCRAATGPDAWGDYAEVCPPEVVLGG